MATTTDHGHMLVSVTSWASTGRHLSRITKGAEHEEHTSRVKCVTKPSV